MGAVVRFDDWPERLDAYLTGRATALFSWGEHDCCAFACGGVEAQTGINPMARASYKTERGALGFIKRNGGSLANVADNLAAESNFQKIPVLMAGRGCPVLGIVNGDQMALGIVGLDSRYALFASNVGYIEMPVSGCIAAWGYE